MFYPYPGGPRPSAIRKRLMHFAFEIIIWDTKVFPLEYSFDEFD
jgi:hypothetical protein